MNRQTRKEKLLQVDLYPVTCERLTAGRSNFDLLDAAIRGGAKIIQLREKELPGGDLYRMALAFRKITAEAGMLLIINDHVDIALAVDADGVHLGQEDLPLSAARRIAPELLIGISTHSREQALKAQDGGADYVNIGPIFPTGTKEGVSTFLGPEAIPGIAAGLAIPFTVMGGIGRANIERVLNRGARRVAVVTAVTMADDMAGAVAALRDTIESGSLV
jgi:thiamine-phosphate pyrophosphorylase